MTTRNNFISCGHVNLPVQINMTAQDNFWLK